MDKVHSTLDKIYDYPYLIIIGLSSIGGFLLLMNWINTLGIFFIATLAFCTYEIKRELDNIIRIKQERMDNILNYLKNSKENPNE